MTTQTINTVYNKTIDTIWSISPADLIDLTGCLLECLGDEYMDPTGNLSMFGHSLNHHIRNLNEAFQTMHKLGCPADSTTPFIQTKWNDRLDNKDCEILAKADASLYWVKSKRHYLLGA